MHQQPTTLHLPLCLCALGWSWHTGFGVHDVVYLFMCKSLLIIYFCLLVLHDVVFYVTLYLILCDVL